MEEEQKQNQENQSKVIVDKPKKKIIPTRLGSLILLLTATIAGAGVWQYEESYVPPEGVDVSKTLEQMKEKREVKDDSIIYSEIDYLNLEPYFNEDKSHIYYDGKIIEGADPSTFKVLKIEGKLDNTDYRFAKDKNHVYCRGIILFDIDPTTFGLIEYGDYYFDKNGTYFSEPIIEGDGSKSDYGEITDLTHSKLEGEVDPILFQKTFKNLDVCYSVGWHITSYNVPYVRYQNGVYCGKNLLQSVDLETFGYIGRYNFEDDAHTVNYAKDKNNVYEDGEVVKGANPTNCTAENIEGCEAPTK